jgi:hypothetical protein
MEADVSLWNVWAGGGSRREQRDQHPPAVPCPARATHRAICAVCCATNAAITTCSHVVNGSNKTTGIYVGMARNEGGRVSLATTDEQAPERRIAVAHEPDRQGQLGGASLDTALEAVYTPRRRMWRHLAHASKRASAHPSTLRVRGIANSSLVGRDPSCMPVSWLRWWLGKAGRELSQ